MTAVGAAWEVVRGLLCGVQEELALQIKVPIACGTNEAKLRWFQDWYFVRVERGDGVHLIELLLFEFAALGLDFAELLQSL